MQLAYCKGMVIVAASGNNSIFNYPPELAHLPADWSSVISVAASNMANHKSNNQIISFLIIFFIFYLVFVLSFLTATLFAFPVLPVILFGG